MRAGVLCRADQRHRLAHKGGNIPRTAAQLGGDLLAGAVLNQAPGQLGFHALGLGAAGQKQRAFHLDKMRRHINELAGDVHTVLLQGADCLGILVDEGHQVDVVEVHLIFADQIQQHIQRAFKILYLKR